MIAELVQTDSAACMAWNIVKMALDLEKGAATTIYTDTLYYVEAKGLSNIVNIFYAEAPQGGIKLCLNLDMNSLVMTSVLKQRQRSQPRPPTRQQRWPLSTSGAVITSA